MKRILVLSCGLALAAQAQSGSRLDGPTQGAVYDAPSRSLRPVAGAFGAATLGPALMRGLDFASMAPRSGRGIACRQEQCFLIGGELLGETPLADQAGVPDGAAWSADGAVAALYSRAEEWIRVVRGGDVSAQWSLASLDADLSAVEVSPDGRTIVFAMTGEHPGVFTLTGEGNFVPLLAASRPVALAYRGSTLLVLDGQEITELAADGVAHRWSVEAVQDPVDLAAGESGGRAALFVAGAADHMLYTFDAASHGLIGETALSFAPSRVEAAGSDYLLTARGGEEDILWAFSANRGVFFVPVTPETTTQRKVRR